MRLDRFKTGYGLMDEEGTGAQAMRLTCPNCGERDWREFYYVGHAIALSRPDEDADAEAWDDYLHNRENPWGGTHDLWYHDLVCGAWIKVTRNTATHEVLATTRVAGDALCGLKGKV